MVRNMNKIETFKFNKVKNHLKYKIRKDKCCLCSSCVYDVIIGGVIVYSNWSYISGYSGKICQQCEAIIIKEIFKE